MATIDSGLQVSNSSLPEHYHISGVQKEAVPSAHPAEALEEQYQRSSKLSSKNHRICGLNPFVFVSIVAVSSALVVGAAIGGGLGSKLSSCQTLVKHL